MNMNWGIVQGKERWWDTSMGLETGTPYTSLILTVSIWSEWENAWSFPLFWDAPRLGTTESPEHICAGSGQEASCPAGHLPSLLIHILNIRGTPYAQTWGTTFSVQPHRTLNFNPMWKADKADIRAAIEFRHMWKIWSWLSCNCSTFHTHYS